MFSFLKPSPVQRITAEAAAAELASGKAVLIDVREADEWAETGVAEPALTLAMSELKEPSEAWKQALAANKGRRVLVYCRSGGRSKKVAELLHAQGFDTANAGGFAEWAAAGLPVRAV